MYSSFMARYPYRKSEKCQEKRILEDVLGPTGLLAHESDARLSQYLVCGCMLGKDG